MSPTGIHGGVGGYDPSLLQSPAGRLSEETSPDGDRTIASDVGPARPTALTGAPEPQNVARPADESTSFLERVTYGRRAPVLPASAVGVRLDVTG